MVPSWILFWRSLDAFTYLSTICVIFATWSSDKFKSMETNETIWGEPTDDFMFRQNDLTMTGIKITQKNMYAYAMVDKDMFVNIHLSKMAASPADSTELMAMLKSLVIKNKAITPSK